MILYSLRYDRWGAKELSLNLIEQTSEVEIIMANIYISKRIENIKKNLGVIMETNTSINMQPNLGPTMAQK